MHDVIDKTLEFIKSQTGISFLQSDDFPGIRTCLGQRYFNVDLATRTSESVEYTALLRLSDRNGAVKRVEPNGLCRVAIFF